MKTVSGELISTQPISISKAAGYLSKFVNSDNGASQSVSAYLRRASTAFNELANVKKQNKRRSKEAGSINLDINPRKSEEIEPRVSEKFGDGSKIEGELRKREKRRIEEDNDMDLNKRKKKKRRRRSEADD